MRELRSCDFCGGDAAGTFEIVPPELEPTETEQRRVALCPDCKDRLRTLIEPLLARAGVASADESTRKRSRESSPNATVSDASDDAEAEPDDDLRAGSASDGADAVTESTLEDGITFERSAAATDDADETAAGNGASDESASDTESTASDAATRPPTAYSKVVRLLRNREFPMKRSAVEELAAGAYDLEPDEVDAIVDYAIEQGEFVEKRGKLKRP